MSNKNKFYTNNQNRVVKQEKKKLKLSQWIVLILMIFWTVGSCLSVYLVFDNRKVETVSAAESVSTSNIIKTPIYYPQENRSISGVTIDWLFPEVFRVGSMMAQSDTVEFYLLAVMLQAGSYSFVAKEHTGVATDVVTFSVVDYEGSFIPNGEFFTFVLEERTYTYLKISVDKDKFANISLKLYQNIDTTDIYNQGYENGKNDGLSEGEDIGYENGYDKGFTESTEQFKYGIFKGATFSGTIGFSDKTEQSFENIIPKNIDYETEYHVIYTGALTRILGIIIVLMLLATLIRKLNGSDVTPTFTSFLELFSNVPEVAIPFQDFSAVNFGDWGVFNFLRDFISMLAEIVNVLIFLFNGIISVITYVVYFFRWLFMF